ncbi:BTB and MATH domain-containing protein 36-like [Pomacea canaliculata]|uniref:BTB and MATH domain-containing protein 36-like n=1 Tax=Pomacea canaliculata TaxID=400727 RepID=UPI000D73BABB|nr:BTB and MATH domain-containing protein 36-like [Pomacea canaliculata]
MFHALIPFEEMDQFSDMALVVEGRKLHVNKAYLMMHSPVFHRMFTSNFKEKNLMEVPLPGKKYSEVSELLKQIYPGEPIDLLNDESLPHLLKLADEYDMRQVFHNCQQHILKNLIDKSRLSTDRVLFYLGIVEKYERLSSLRETLIDLASRIFTKDLEKSKHFPNVPATAMRDALFLRLKRIESTQYASFFGDINPCLWRP